MHEFVLFINDLLARPMVLVVLLCVFFLFFLKSLKLDFPAFVAAVNDIGSQPFALVVMVIGFWMLIESKKFGIDTTIAGAVIGVASNMLQAQIKDAAHPPPGAAVKTSMSIESTTPATPGANQPGYNPAAPTPTPQGRAYRAINQK
jgi:uncharacterized membrane protein